MTWELVVDLGERMAPIALLTGHPDTLAKPPATGVQVTPATAYQRGSFPVRAWSWTKYTVQSFLWLWKWPRNVPILVFSNPPIGPWAAALMQMLRGTPYVLMVHDIYPDVVVRMGVASERNPLIRLWRAINRWAYNRAELVMTLGENMAGVLSPQFDVSKTRTGRVEVVYPWADTKRFQPIAKEANAFARTHGQHDKLTVMYSGNMGLGHDIETMLAAAERLQTHSRLHFMFVGAGPKWKVVEQTIKEKQLANVTLLPWQDESMISVSLAAADIAFVSLEPELAALAIPSKAFYFLAAGVPLLVLSTPNSELSSVVEENRCGWVRSPGDVDGLVNILESVSDERVNIEQMQSASRNAALTIGSRQRNSAEIYKLLVEYVVSDTNTSTS